MKCVNINGEYFKMRFLQNQRWRSSRLSRNENLVFNSNQRLTPRNKLLLII